MLVCVTGVLGFIGGALALDLLQRDVKVIGIDKYDGLGADPAKDKRRSQLLIHPGFGLITSDINAENLRHSIREHLNGQTISICLHFAALPGVRGSGLIRDEYEYNNILGTENLLSIMNDLDVGRFIFASTSAVYGDESQPFKENLKLKPARSFYGHTKQVGENRVLEWAQSGNPNRSATVLRLFSVYGPGMRDDLAISIFQKALEAGLPITLFGDGSDSRDYTYIDDVLYGIDLAMRELLNRRTGAEIINIGTGHAISTSELVHNMQKSMGKNTAILYHSRSEEEMLSTEADLTKAQELIGYKPQWDLVRGLQSMLTPALS